MPQALVEEFIFGRQMPSALADALYEAFGGTQKGITAKDLFAGLALLTRGTESEKRRLLFHMCKADPSDDRATVTGAEMLRLAEWAGLAAPGSSAARSIAHVHMLTFDDFSRWLNQVADPQSFIGWILSSSKSAFDISASVREIPTFYQTLSGVTHLTEDEVSHLEKFYLQTRQTHRRFDDAFLHKVLRTAVPDVFVQGIFNGKLS